MSSKYLNISFNLYGKHFNKLTKEQKDKVIEIYYDFY
jgi:hypothetical protein